jgi:hypothetical protein
MDVAEARSQYFLTFKRMQSSEHATLFCERILWDEIKVKVKLFPQEAVEAYRIVRC